MRVLLTTVFAVSAAVGISCCITYDQIKMRLVGEDAIIVWDQKAGVEHFIRSAVFDGQAKNFGFVLPVPSKPFAMEVANEKVFATLERFGPPTKSLGMPGAGGRSLESAGVEVIERKLVGDYEATVLKATDGKSITNWLQANGHQMRPAMVPWFQHYTKQNWMFVAFKYSGKNGAIDTKAVRVSFKTDKPHYPYKMPSDTFGATEARPLRLFVVSQTPVKGAYTSGKEWVTKPRWTSLVDDKRHPLLEKELSLENPLPKDLYVTRFENSPLAINYSEDLVFSKGPLVSLQANNGQNDALPIFGALGLGSIVFGLRVRGKRD